MIKIGSIGYNHCHDGSFVVDHPNGPGAWLFLLIKTPALLSLNGEDYILKAGTAVMISPHTICRYGALKDGYIDDWFYFGMTDEDISALADLGIYANRPIYLGAVERLSNLIYEMTIEFYSVEPRHGEIVALYTEILINRISRMVTRKSVYDTELSADRRMSLARLRSRIYGEPADLPAVTVLAYELGISVSGLEHQYKKAFGTSVINDIITSRILYAKRLLLSSNMPVAAVAEKCGYNSCYSFMRQFKARTGMTPTELRRREAVGEWSEKG